MPSVYIDPAKYQKQATEVRPKKPAPGLWAAHLAGGRAPPGQDRKSPLRKAATSRRPGRRGGRRRRKVGGDRAQPGCVKGEATGNPGKAETPSGSAPDPAFWLADRPAFFAGLSPGEALWLLPLRGKQGFLTRASTILVAAVDEPGRPKDELNEATHLSNAFSLSSHPLQCPTIE
jgi:hypothetical protein